MVRALAVVRLLAQSPSGLSQAQVAERLELPVPTAYRLLSVLEREGFATRSQTNKKYFLGPVASEIAQQRGSHNALNTNIHHLLQEASRELSETVFLAERSGNHIICTALAESDHPLRLFVRQGQIMPAHAAASARVVLAGCDPAVVDTIIAASDWKHYTSGTITTPGALYQKLDEIRERGYDVCESELDHNVWAVSAPVKSSLGDTVASVTMAAPVQRFQEPQQQQKAIMVITETARLLSQEIGGTTDHS